MTTDARVFREAIKPFDPEDLGTMEPPEPETYDRMDEKGNWETVDNKKRGTSFYTFFAKATELPMTPTKEHHYFMGIDGSGKIALQRVSKDTRWGTK